jgi:hypothetical protein
LNKISPRSPGNIENKLKYIFNAFEGYLYNGIGVEKKKEMDLK